MRRVSLLMVVLALAALLAFAQTTQKPKPAAPSQGAEQELINLEHEWASAFMHGDVAAVERIEAPGFVYTDYEGKVMGRADDIADVKAGAYKAEFDLQDMKVHLFGDTAVVTGRNVIKGTYKGQDMSGTYVFTDTFIKRGGRWQAVASQGTKIK